MEPRYDVEQHGEQGRMRHGSPLFYQLLQQMAETHDKKSHDYASDSNLFGNYHFAGMLSKLFDNPDDAGFIGRIGEKLYRLANLENNKKETKVKDEGIEDTETDIAVITLLWIVDRRTRRAKQKTIKSSDITPTIENNLLQIKAQIKLLSPIEKRKLYHELQTGDLN